MKTRALIKPELDPEFVPAALWNRAYQAKVQQSGASREVSIALLRPDHSCTRFETRMLANSEEDQSLNLRYLERILKFLLWQRGGHRILIAGADEMVAPLAALYTVGGERDFDQAFFGEQIYLEPLTTHRCAFNDLPAENEGGVTLGRHLDGCRIGFDLGGSDRKCAALIDGEVVFSEEVEWSPYFETNPEFHLKGINDSLERAAAHLPRVDAIGGSAAGVYVNNEVRAASLFRGVSAEDFKQHVVPIFAELKKRWGGVPFDVVNDGEVTALAGSMSMEENGMLGLAMGTSEAVGYVGTDGRITPMLNELAFAPVDYRDKAPADEWSGDLGCGVQYFSQQAVARLIPASGLEISAELPFPEQLVKVQQAMAAGDERAKRIYATIGCYLGYSLAHYAAFYRIRKVLLLGRVTSGHGGTVIIEVAREVLTVEFPELARQIDIVVPNEQDKRHGQAVAAASLPVIESTP
ncbi:ROK family protein [Haloferula sp.]|uniref:ROK family protein n=1 Tax=Haloferula sp. TaxID=2497595 RepID=UPI00329E55BD